MDIRNVAPVHNGTSQAILGLVQAFSNLDERWSISLLATEEGARFHGLARSFRDWPVYTSLPDEVFSVAFRPSQPWHLQEMVDLHSRALINVYLLLDTISWDVAYCAPPHLEGVWQFLASYADGLVYDSEFTRQRFLARFPAGANVPGAVTHFSFEPADYTNGAVPADPRPGGYILVVGNHLDHKDVRLTTRTLTTAFPYREIRVLGPTDIGSPSVVVHASGGLAPDEIHRLYAGADCVVYPSVYEGFGFPILMGLAYGRTVMARRSALVEELAPRCHGRGRLVVFDRREDLVDLIGRLSAGESIAGLSLAGPLSQPRKWRDVALATRDFLSSLMRDRPGARWAARERTVRQLISYRG
jgi:glycosyltransferase involved in cell wall biosynthesis